MHSIAHSDTATTIADYCDRFDAIERQFEKGTFDDANIGVARILDKVEQNRASSCWKHARRSRKAPIDIYTVLQNVKLAESASLVVDGRNPKQCLPGTRVDILEHIEAWFDSAADDNSRRVLLLTGAAGSGKSAIAHTIASRYNDLGRLGGSFAFSRETAARKVYHLFPHIARLLCNQGDPMKKALADLVEGEAGYTDTTDIDLQFDRFLVKPLSELTILAPILIVIDAIDEAPDISSADKESLERLLTCIATRTKELPTNLRVLITTRPEARILQVLNMITCPGLFQISTSDISSTEHDLHKYVQSRLLSPSLPGINEECCEKLARMGQGLFQWVSVACNEVRNAKSRGVRPREKYDRITSSATADQPIYPLDSLYATILTDHFPLAEHGAVENLAVVMSFVFALRTPLPEQALHKLWQASGRDTGDLDIVLEGGRSLLDGVGDATRPVQPSHASLRDFLTDRTRSGPFFINVSSAHPHLVIATLQIMQEQLRFNICDLESSYVMNDTVTDLKDRIGRSISRELSYSCLFWTSHLAQVPSRTTIEVADAPVVKGLHAVLTIVFLIWFQLLSIVGGAPGAMCPSSATVGTTPYTLVASMMISHI